jgi:hypothetical protein
MPRLTGELLYSRFEITIAAVFLGHRNEAARLLGIILLEGFRGHWAIYPIRQSNGEGEAAGKIDRKDAAADQVTPD